MDSLLLESPDNVETIIDPKDAAESAGLRYVSDARPGIGRKTAGTGFSYTRADGSKLTGRVKAIIVIEVRDAAPLVSPAYDDEATTEAEMLESQWARFTRLRDRRAAR